MLYLKGSISLIGANESHFHLLSCSVTLCYS